MAKLFERFLATHKATRRQVFIGLGAAAATGLAAKISQQSNVSNPTSSSEPDSPGYRLSEHVKKYYRTTTI